MPDCCRQNCCSCCKCCYVCCCKTPAFICNCYLHMLAVLLCVCVCGSLTVPDTACESAILSIAYSMACNAWGYEALPLSTVLLLLPLPLLHMLTYCQCRTALMCMPLYCQCWLCCIDVIAADGGVTHMSGLLSLLPRLSFHTCWCSNSSRS